MPRTADPRWHAIQRVGDIRVTPDSLMDA